MELEEETRLVAQLLSGDSRALEQFVAAYRRFITSILSRQPNLCAGDVEELYQRFLLHIWEDDYRRLRPWSGTRSLRAYLGAVARNLARDYRRERRRLSECAEYRDMGVLPVPECHRESARVAALKSALVKLSDRDRDLIYRRYFLDETYREIAQGLGMTVNHVGVTLFRAETRLKIMLKKVRADL
jgi:RNA polymerase sigma factor (sigma-70 family)